ncbi:hypothetical protein Tco_0323052 [Tanacetum coccineum]
MSYSNEGPSLTYKKPLTQEEVSRENMAKDIYERIMILKEPRPIIETLKFSDQHKKLLDSVLLDKLKLDGEVELEEEAATEEVIRNYKAIKEKKDLGVSVMSIRIKAKFDFHALADIVEPMGIIKDVLCQIGVTMILAKFLILDILVDRDVLIVVGRSFLYTCGSILNIIKGTTSIFDGVCHQNFYLAKVRNNHGESDSDDEEEYILKRDKNGNPFYGPIRAKYLSCDDHMKRALTLQETLNPFKKVCVWKKMISFLRSLPIPLQHTEWILGYSEIFSKKGDVDGKWHAKVRIVDPYGNVFYQGYETRATERKMSKYYKLSVLNGMGCGDVIEEMLEIKVYEMRGEDEILTSKAWRRAFDISDHTELCHEFYATYEFDEEVTDKELMSNKLIKFRLCGCAHSLTILEFAYRLGLYTSDEIQDDGFETYF